MDSQRPRRTLIAGNWKMNLSAEEGGRLAEKVVLGATNQNGLDILLAPPFTSLSEVRKRLHWSRILLCGQNMNENPEGAFTGEVSAEMLLTSGCTAVILGHSERRILLSESSILVGQKVARAVARGLTPILCVGESIEELNGGDTERVLESQLVAGLAGLDLGLLKFDGGLERSLVIAYEPIWAIGSGSAATPELAQVTHQFIRGWLSKKVGTENSSRLRILYGGSVNSLNAEGILSQPDIDGALVGTASLLAEDFLGIVAKAPGYRENLPTTDG